MIKLLIRKLHWLPSRRVLLSLTALACVLLPAIAFARAGGGGGFSGGGGHSGGSGGGDGIFVLIMLLIHYPVVGVPVAIIAVIFFLKSGKAGHSAHISHTIRQGYMVQESQNLEIGLANLRERDPAFDIDAFAERCKVAFPKVQNAWSKQNMTPGRHLVSDGIYERFQLQLKMQKESYLRNVMENVEVSTVELVAVQSDDFFDTLHVKINASAIDYTEDSRKSRIIDGSKSSEPFSEIWSFLRRPGAKTLENPGLIEGFCPNCGTPLEISDSTKCPSCQAVINSGEYDWVLSEITQVEVWADPSTAAVPGLAEMVEKDSAFNVQHVEDRMSVIFWRLRAAEFFASDTYLKKLALPQYLEAHAGDFRPLDDGRHAFSADAAVGSVELSAIELSDDSEGLDRIHVHVKWSGHDEKLKVPSLIKPAYESSRFKSQDFVLVRRADVKTSSANTLTSSHCPGCGAPQTVNTNGACEYCGAVQNDGSCDWVLEEIQPYFAFAGRSLPSVSKTSAVSPVLSTKLSSKDNELLLQCAVAVMMSDGVIDPKEEKVLQQMAGHRGISESRLKQLVSDVQLNGSVTAPAAGNGQENREFLRALITMCLADGNVSSGEKSLIKSLVAHMQYRDADIDQMIKKERARLYEQSKLIIKASKSG
jgi:tellurite resistance protein/uncharacterized Zn finger protein (UPF0148 family)